MGIRSMLRCGRGQMTVEMAVAFPVLIVVAVVAVNALSFFVECGMFDRIAHDAVRVHASAPAYEQSVDQTCELVKQAIEGQLGSDNLAVSVTHGIVGVDLDEYTVTLEFYPSLFGRGLRSKVFGVTLPSATHTTRYVIDSYRAGVVV